MDELDILTAVRSNPPPPSTALLADIRHQIAQREIGHTGTVSIARPRSQTGHRLAWRAAVGTAATVAAAGTALIVTTATNSGSNPATPQAGPGSLGTATGQAPAPAYRTVAQFLDLAATRALQVGDPTPGPGQYTYVHTHAWGQGAIAARGCTAVYETEGQYQTWIPASADGTWYWRYTRPTATKFFDAASKQCVQQQGPHILDRHVELYTGRDGEITKDVTPGPGGEPMGPPGPASWDNPTPDWLAGLPRDPAALRASLYADSPTGVKPGSGLSRDTVAFGRLADVLASGLVPADLRAALYRVATTIPGVTLVDHEADLDGRSGIAVGRVESSGTLRQDLIFDTAGGQFLGEREVAVRAYTTSGDSGTGANAVHSTGPTIPAGTVVSSTAVTVAVSDKPNLP